MSLYCVQEVYDDDLVGFWGFFLPSVKRVLKQLYFHHYILVCSEIVWFNGGLEVYK